MKVSVKVEGDLGKLDILGFLNAFNDEFVKRVEVRTPVRSGALRDGYQSDVTIDQIQLGNSQDYLQYIEEGTSTIAPVGMIRTTMEEADAIADRVKDKLYKK